MEKKYSISELQKLKKQRGFLHKKFGDLNSPDCINLQNFKKPRSDFTPSNPYFVHLSITGRCNARCKGCINATISYKDREKKFFLSTAADTKPARDAKAILKLAENSKQNEVAVCFYGGEPLLLADKLRDVVTHLENNKNGQKFKFMLYTNGELLNNAMKQWPKMPEKIWLYSVSIDGGIEQHNEVRTGTDLSRIRKNLQSLDSHRKGQVLMWSTLRESQSLADCFREFMNLQSKQHVDHFFWHWVETDTGYEDFQNYLKNYEKHLNRIMDVYIQNLKNAKLLSIVHINELILFALCGIKRGSSACGVELERNFDIAGGKIMPCSDMGFESSIGYIDNSGNTHIQTADFKNLVAYKQDLGCDHCGVGTYCGGRCPVEALTSGARRLIEYCQLMRLHVAVVCQYLDRITELYEKAGITLQDVYDKSAYLAQFTDVTP